jgi:hypothetical protein
MIVVLNIEVEGIDFGCHLFDDLGALLFSVEFLEIEAFVGFCLKSLRFHLYLE